MKTCVFFRLTLLFVLSYNEKQKCKNKDLKGTILETLKKDFQNNASGNIKLVKIVQKCNFVKICLMF